MTRLIVALLIFAYAACELIACGGQLRGDVDAEAGFDLDAHWGESCYDYHGPVRSCHGVDGAPLFEGEGCANCVNKYCGVLRTRCLYNGTYPCTALMNPPFACCGDHLTTHYPEDVATRIDPGVDTTCLPYGLDDGSGLPPLGDL